MPTVDLISEDEEAVFRRDLRDRREILVETLRPLRERYAELSADPATVTELLKQGADAVRPIARATVDNVKRAMGAL